MSLVHVPHYSQAGSHGGLLANVAGALRAVAHALFAAQPAAKSVAVDTAAVKEADREELSRLARECESFSPSLAAELHFIARQ